ncbi:DUF3800 domain-containing protein [Actinomyces culturomici]|uniref:DUF3800 domain-containing protein n=1 Tax=Actinomyces culturomici TaxID=1926276 RepID=UPI00135A1698|nr:DUF3800 domain-containing protein [Actinomyces culturomici]
MLIAYLDESQRDGCYIIGAAVAEQAVWEVATDRLAALRSELVDEFQLPSGIEFHGHPLMQSSGDWRPLKGKHREKATAYLKALSTIDDLDISFVFRGLDIERQRAKYKDPWPSHSACMTFTLESLDDFARARGEASVIVVSDESSYERELTRRFEHDRSLGTFGYRRSLLERISDPLNWSSSKDTDELQIVDLALYVWQRSAWPLEAEHPKAKATREKLLRKLDSKIFRGEIWRP